MIIKSSSNSNFTYIISALQNIVSITSYSVLLGMSYGGIPEDLEMLLALFALGLVIQNVLYSNSTREQLQYKEDKPFQQALKEHMVLSPIVIILSLGALGTLLTGNMFAWPWYLGVIVVSTIITKVHQNRLGVKSKD